jgi:broad specificity phosphatase PhoE
MLKINLLEKPRNIESPEARGRNVELRLIFIRHGEKDPNDKVGGRLTEYGKQQFEEFAERELSNPDRTLVVFGSDIVRTLQSGHSAFQKSKANFKSTPDPLNALSRDPNRVPKISDDFLKKIVSMSPNENVQHWMSYGDKRPDESTMSPREMAAGLAQLIVDYDKKIDNIQSGSKTDVLAVSHDFILSSFLQEAFGIKPAQGDESVHTAEPFFMTIRTDDTGTHSLQFEFRGKKYNIKIDELRELANYHYEQK